MVVKPLIFMKNTDKSGNDPIISRIVYTLLRLTIIFFIIPFILISSNFRNIAVKVNIYRGSKVNVSLENFSVYRDGIRLKSYPGGFTGKISMEKGYLSIGTQGRFKLPVRFVAKSSKVKVQDSWYYGKLEFRNYKGKNILINILPMDMYLYGVLPNEICPGWNMTTLRVQAIASRTDRVLISLPVIIKSAERYIWSSPCLTQPTNSPIFPSSCIRRIIAA